jgi:hypothetical protein
MGYNRNNIKFRSEDLVLVFYMGISSSSSSLARQPYVGPGLPQKLLPAEVSSYFFFRFLDESIS